MSLLRFFHLYRGGQIRNGLENHIPGENHQLFAASPQWNLYLGGKRHFDSKAHTSDHFANHCRIRPCRCIFMFSVDCSVVDTPFCAFKQQSLLELKLIKFLFFEKYLEIAYSFMQYTVTIFRYEFFMIDNSNQGQVVTRSSKLG